jgi:hypothetical protein
MFYKNERGFAPLAIVLIIVLIGLVGGAGWRVYQQKQTKQSSNTSLSTNSSTNSLDQKQDPEDETSEWRLFKTQKPYYSFRMPDGWGFTYQTDNDVVYASDESDMEYRAGTPATVSEVTGGRDGLIGFLVAFDEKNVEYVRTFEGYQNLGEFKTADGLVGTKYSMEITDEGEGIGPPAGSKLYAYYFTNSEGAGIYASYTRAPGAADKLDIVEKAVRTLKFL